MGKSLFLGRFDGILRKSGITAARRHSDGTLHLETLGLVLSCCVCIAPQNFERKETCECHEARVIPTLLTAISAEISNTRNGIVQVALSDPAISETE